MEFETNNNLRGSQESYARCQNMTANSWKDESVQHHHGRTCVATLPALYRAQNQENREIPFSESKNTLCDPPLGTHLNGHFGH